mmetsp:Transcript_94975/g.252203  ORF Transcript_94975/g.252203 Transcript_94975/m.252203 type:complete len:126 (+) Transcript_94975:2-379(+)
MEWHHQRENMSCPGANEEAEEALDNCLEFAKDTAPPGNSAGDLDGMNMGLLPGSSIPCLIWPLPDLLKAHGEHLCGTGGVAARIAGGVAALSRGGVAGACCGRGAASKGCACCWMRLADKARGIA